MSAIDSSGLQISRHAVQAMLGDAIRRGRAARGVLTGATPALLERAAPMKDEEHPLPEGEPRAVYVASDGSESVHALRERAGDAALAGLPLVVIRLGEAGRLEATMLDADGREWPLTLREDGMGGCGAMPHAK